jgi:hypothetical protein
MQLFGPTVMFLTHEKIQGLSVFLSTGNSFLIGRQVAKYSCLSHIASCPELQVFVHFTGSGYFSRSEGFSIVKGFHLASIPFTC